VHGPFPRARGRVGEPGNCSGVPAPSTAACDERTAFVSSVGRRGRLLFQRRPGREHTNGAWNVVAATREASIPGATRTGAEEPWEVMDVAGSRRRAIILVGAWLAVAWNGQGRAAPADEVRGAERFYGQVEGHERARMCVLQRQEGDSVRFWVANDYPFPVSLRFHPRFVNMVADVEFPLTRTFAPHSLTSVYRARRQLTGIPYSWHNDWTWRMGPIASPGATEVRYRLPFPTGFPVHVSQGPHGGFSHRGAHAEAIDWALPRGTPVLCAREGMVIFVRDMYRGRSLDPSFIARTNTITVLHEDGTMAEYSHIDTHSARVKPGQRVSVGDVLALSGDVGYSDSEHLHFRVFRLGEQLEEESLPLLFQPDAAQ